MKSSMKNQCLPEVWNETFTVIWNMVWYIISGLGGPHGQQIDHDPEMYVG